MILRRIQYIFLILVIILASISITHALTIETKKGDVIMGDFGMEKLKVQLQLGGVVEIPLSELTEISENMDIFKLRDGMVLRGKITDEKLTIKTRFGEVVIPLSEVKKIDIEAVKKPVVLGKIPSAIPGKVAPEGDWSVRLGREVGVFHERFRIELEHVEKKGDTLLIGIGFRNISKGIQRIRLTRDYQQTTALLDDDVGTEYNLRGVKGITGRDLAVNPGAKQLAVFTFPFPPGVKKARFVSNWMWVDWLALITLSIPFTIPSEGIKEGK